MWQDKYAAEAVGGAAGSHPGPRSSPALAEGKVVTLGVGGVLSCLDAGSGKLLWRKDVFPHVVPMFFAASSPLLVEGMCIAQLGGKGDHAIVAFELASGEQKWKWTGDGPAYASPVLATIEGTKQLVAQTEKSLVGLVLADGELLWRIAAAPKARSLLQLGHTDRRRPDLDLHRAGRGHQGGEDRKTGRRLRGQELWKNETLGTGYNTPVLKDGLLFGLSDKGNLFCLDAGTGAAAWTDTARHDRFGAIVNAGAVMLALPPKSGLIAFKPSGKRYEELARFTVSDTPIYAHPVVAGKRIFVKGRETLTMLAIE